MPQPVGTAVHKVLRSLPSRPLRGSSAFGFGPAAAIHKGGRYASVPPVGRHTSAGGTGLAGRLLHGPSIPAPARPDRPSSAARCRRITLPYGEMGTLVHNPFMTQWLQCTSRVTRVFHADLVATICHYSAFRTNLADGRNARNGFLGGLAVPTGLRGSQVGRGRDMVWVDSHGC